MGGRKQTPAVEFRQAIDQADYLRWRPGLQAVPRAEGRNRITARESGRLLGGSNIDQDCLDARAYQNENRWDFVIGYDRNGKTVAFFLEVHSAITSQVTCMVRKWEWLGCFLTRDANEKLRMLEREGHWIAGGGMKIPKHVRQYKLLKRLNAQGLRGPVESLVLS